MQLSFITENETFNFDSSNFFDLSIPIDFYGAQPNAFGVENATASPCAYGNILGDTRNGGSCNFEEYRLIPHCNGTHTESIGHILNERSYLIETLTDVLIPCTLVSVETEEAKEPQRKMITSNLLDAALTSAPNTDISDAVVIRTLPNEIEKLTRQYNPETTPAFTSQAIELLVQQNFRHLVCDLPSIDCMNDGGRLKNHRIFWNLPKEGFEKTPDARINNSVTELAFIPNEVPDGFYLLNLQITAFMADASPSRPILFPLSK
ncbi:MAG: cyclase family protein [Pyrinomonadaceae bacterium]